MFTEEYQRILRYIEQLTESPFKYTLKEYCSDIVDNPKCIYCNKREDGIESGMSPQFDDKWTKGFSVCFHICHICNCNIESANESWLRSQIHYR